VGKARQFAKRSKQLKARWHKLKTLSIGEYMAAAAVRTAGGTLLEVHQNGGARCVMLFDDSDGKASDLLARHRAGTLEISSREMADSIQSVKNEIFAARRG